MSSLPRSMKWRGVQSVGIQRGHGQSTNVTYGATHVKLISFLNMLGFLTGQSLSLPAPC
jgi:hypothetical protein